jgi:hypothetical protein
MLRKQRHTPVRETGTRKGAARKAESRELPASLDCAGVPRGLCINCDVRNTCTFPKPEGGVWFCEEYQ